MNDHLRPLLLIAVMSMILVACASRPIDTEVQPNALTPEEVSRSNGIESGELAASVLWGGVIVSISNLERSTQLEVLAYPLSNRQKPQRSRAAQGRFLVQVEGYLEAVDYAAGRMVTVLGRLEGVTEGRIGETRYPFPNVRSEQLHLWPETRDEGRSGFSLGLGISL